MKISVFRAVLLVMSLSVVSVSNVLIIAIYVCQDNARNAKTAIIWSPSIINNIVSIHVHQEHTKMKIFANNATHNAQLARIPIVVPPAPRIYILLLMAIVLISVHQEHIMMTISVLNVQATVNNAKI